MSRVSWQSLSLDARRELIELGEEATIDVPAVLAVTNLATPLPDEIEPIPDPPVDRVPDEIPLSLGPARRLSLGVWSSLGPLDRYAFAKIAEKGRTDRAAEAYAEIIGQTAVSTHLGASGGARMVGVGEKPVTVRTAVGRSVVTMSETAFRKLESADVGKGDVLGTARIAGILAAKRTPELIPLCHHVALTRVSVELELEPATWSVRILATAEAVDRTGVEMEALVAASVAALTVYDMLKSSDRGMVIGPTELVWKSGGRTGDFER